LAASSSLSWKCSGSSPSLKRGFSPPAPAAALLLSATQAVASFSAGLPEEDCFLDKPPS